MRKPTNNGQEPAESGEELLKIGDFARLAETNLRTLRYYEELGLVKPASRSQGGFRYYHARDVHRLEMIRSLQELGLPLESIRDVVVVPPRNGDKEQYVENLREALHAQGALLEERIRALEEQRERVLAGLEKLEDCIACDREPSSKDNLCDPCQNSGDPMPESLRSLFL